MDDLESLAHALARIARDKTAEVYDGAKAMPQLAGFEYELRQRGNEVLLHLWTGEGNLVRRVIRIREITGDSLELEVHRFGRRDPGKLRLVRKDRSNAPGRLSRDKFRARFAQLLAEKFPDESVETLTTAADLERSFSGCYARGITVQGSRAWAVMGASPAEPAAICDGMLSFGLLWLDWVRRHRTRGTVSGLRLVLPRGAAATTAHRMRALDTAVRVELHELEETTGSLERVDVRDAGNIATWLTPRKSAEMVLEEARPSIERIRELAPAAIDAVVPPGSKDVALRFHGLEFARWHAGRLEYGLPEKRRELTEKHWPNLKRLVQRLRKHRTAAAVDRNHSLFRAVPERWLESLMARQPEQVDAHLDARYLYSQVPAFSAGDRGVLDLLGVRRDGRLVVMELKAAEDIHLVMQAADYWMRVWQHHHQGEFQAHGYFRGIELSPKPPILCLIAPGFRFHPANETILRYLSAEIEVSRIGLNEQWREGIQVVFRQ